MTEPILHLAQPGDWAASTDEYHAPSLDDEGFIHCSTASQLASVARTHFGGHNDLILLSIDPEPLGNAVVYEDLYGLGEEYPHIYGPLPTVAVLTTGPYIEHLEEGLWLGETRNDREWMDKILHPDFAKVARSGRTYDRTGILEADAVDLEIDLPLDGYRFDLIDEDVALARYVSRASYDGVDLPAQRTSVWINTNEGWQLRFHQGTPLP